MCSYDILFIYYGGVAHVNFCLEKWQYVSLHKYCYCEIFVPIQRWIIVIVGQWWHIFYIILLLHLLVIKTHLLGNWCELSCLHGQFKWFCKKNIFFFQEGYFPCTSLGCLELAQCWTRIGTFFQCFEVQTIHIYACVY